MTSIRTFFKASTISTHVLVYKVNQERKGLWRWRNLDYKLVYNTMYMNYDKSRINICILIFLYIIINYCNIYHIFWISSWDLNLKYTQQKCRSIKRSAWDYITTKYAEDRNRTLTVNCTLNFEQVQELQKLDQTCLSNKQIRQSAHYTSMMCIFFSDRMSTLISMISNNFTDFCVRNGKKSTQCQSKEPQR